VDRWRIDRADSLADLRRMAQRWAADHREALAKADPDVPAGLHDRAADNWRPLLAIADVAGGNWPTRARQAIEAIEAIDTDDEDLSCLLLRDLRDLFAACKADRLPSADICKALAAVEDRPWPTLCRGNPITPHRLARMLAVYGIVAGSIRIGDKTPKGYTLSGCLDAFHRYIPPEKSATPPQGTNDAASWAKSNRNTTPHVADRKTLQIRI
jgi:hypothetical protein